MNKSIIQRMLIVLTLLAGAMSAASAADRFYIDAVNIEPGETKQLAFMLENSQEFFGFQADITLPEGLEFVQANGKADFKLSSRADASYNTVSNLLANGSLRVGAFSTTHTAISGNGGALMYANVHASDDFTGGTLAMSGILFVGSSDHDVKLPDFTIELGAKHNDRFYIPDFKIAVGETKTISIELDNETSFTAFQTDLYLPEGMNIVENSFKLTSRGSGRHSISAKSFTDGRTRIICMSLSNDIFTGNSGALLNLDVTANKDVAETAVIEMKNQIFSMANAREYVIPNSQTTVTTERALVESITLEPSSVAMVVGDTKIVTANVLPSFASTKDVEWTSANPSVATVSQSGLITAVGIGQTTIMATAVDGSGVAAACEVSVSGIPVTNIMLSRTSATLKATETVTLTATVSPANASDKSLRWESSDAAIATVDAGGNVTAVAVGKAVITATSQSNPEITTACNIAVVPTPVSQIVINQTSVSLKVGATFAFVASVLPETATNKEIAWYSDNTTIASIDDKGVVTALSLGRTAIKAVAKDGSEVVATATVNVVPTPAESISIQAPATTEFKVGETISLTASVLPENASDKSVVWSSSDSNIATVSATGVVTAINVGNVVVKATNSAGVSSEIQLTVVPTLAESISVLPSVMTLKVNETGLLTVNLTPSATTDKNVSFESSDMAVAIVDENGTVKAQSIGEAFITVTTKDGSNISAKCKVEVIPTPAESVSIKYDGPTSLRVGQAVQLSVEVLPENTTDKSVEWQSQNNEVLSVDANGLVSATGLGEAWISVRTTNGQTAFITFSVIPTPVSTISLNQSSVSLKAGEAFGLSATVLPDNATDKSVTWHSSNKAVATVSDEGVITGVSVGEADITVSATDASGVSAVCNVKVVPTPAESIKIDQVGPIELDAGETYQLSAIVLPEDATDKTVKWSSDATGGVIVDDNGLLHAIAVGEFSVTAANSSGQSDMIVVKVNPAIAKSIQLNRTTASIKVADNLRLTVTFTPESTTNKTLVWKSSDTSVASVSDSGVVTAHALGNCVVTATTTDGSNITVSCDITVGETAAESVSIEPKGPFVLNIGESVKLSATVLPHTTTDQSVAWLSQTSAVTVNQDGLVTAVAPVENNWIEATNSAGQTDMVYVTVLPTLVSAINVDKSSVALKVGESVKVAATVEPGDASDKTLVWLSDNSEIATVDDSGNIFAKALGNTTVTVTAKDGSGVSTSVSVSVIPTPATGIEIVNPEITHFKVGQTLRLAAIVTPEDATDGSVVWSSDNTSIATVDAKGIVTAVGVGDVNVTAENSSGQKAAIKIVVEPTIAESLIITNTGVDMHVGEAFQFEAQILPSTTTNKTLTWISSDSDIVAIDNNGKATAKRLGEATIEVATTDGSNLTATCPVWVKPVPVEQVVINYDGAKELRVGDKIQLNATVFPDNATVKTIEWVSQTSALSVDQTGLVTANDIVEQSWIGAFSPASPYSENPPADYKVAIIYFSVVKTLVERIEIVNDNGTMYAGETKQLTAIVYPESATDKSVVWESSNPSIISVDNNGLLTALQAGYADIKATAADGSMVYASTRIEVAAIPVESIIITANGSTELKDGETLQLTATVYPETATDKSVRWVTNAPYRATVDENGLVTAHSDIGVLDIWAIAGDVSDKIMLTIVETPAEQVSIYLTGESSTTILDGEEVYVGATIMPLTTTDKTITWSCSDESILKITDNNDGTCIVTGIAPGSAYLIATTSNGISESIYIEVKPILVESISLPDQITLDVSQRYDLMPEIAPNNASKKEWIWQSSNLSVGSMYGNTFYAYSQGETTITCRTTDGSDLSASCVITVVKYATSITLSEHDVAMKEGESFALTAEIQPVDATSKEVMWSSSDENVVTVSETGLIEAKSVGKAVVEVHTRYYPWLADECNVTVENNAGIESVTIDGVDVKVKNNQVIISALANGSIARLYGLDGVLLNDAISNGADIIFDVTPNTCYILSLGRFSLKIYSK